MKNRQGRYSGYQNIISKWSKCAIIIFFSVVISGQSRTDLEKERDKIIQEIELTQQSLKKTKANKSEQLKSLQFLNQQIKKRQELIGNLQDALITLDQEMANNRELLSTMSNSVSEIQSQYEELLRYTYLRKLGTNKWIYILSAESLNKAFLRWRYTHQFEEYCLRKAEELKLLQDEIEKKNLWIQKSKEEQNNLLSSESKQITLLDETKSEKNNLLAELKKDEAKLRRELNQRNEERERLNKAIEDAIVAELRRAESSVSSAETSANLKLTGQFADNRGKLPWPVENGYVQSPFGQQAHPTIKGLKINNNGVDIVAGSGENIKAIFGGKVIGVTRIPGYDNMAIIQHGDYYSVYSKLASVYVVKDEEIKTGQIIGSLGEDKNELHIEIWKNKTKVDPQKWLVKR